MATLEQWRNQLQNTRGIFQNAMGETESHMDISYTKKLSTAVYSFLSQTNQTQHFVLTRPSCIYLCFSPLLVSSPKQSVFIFERVTSKKIINLVIVVLFPLRKKYISGSVNVTNSVVRKSCNSKQSNYICGELPNWNKFLIWTAKY